MAEELKPCPFCGNPPDVIEFSNGWSVDCERDGCLIQPCLQDMFHAKEDAIKAWNTRPEVFRLTEELSTERDEVELKDAALKSGHDEFARLKAELTEYTEPYQADGDTYYAMSAQEYAGAWQRWQRELADKDACIKRLIDRLNRSTWNTQEAERQRIAVLVDGERGDFISQITGMGRRMGAQRRVSSKGVISMLDRLLAAIEVSTS